MNSHVCRESETCNCSSLALEPNESCPQHGMGEYPPRCCICGHFLPNKLAVGHGWAFETMIMINKLTPEIKGKAFDPGWFVLRERLEEAERKMEGNANV